jgi:plastocyanin
MRFAVLLAAAGLTLVAAVAVLGGRGASAQSTTTVEVGDLYFCDPSFQDDVCATTVNEGDTVEWQFAGFQPHSTSACSDDHAACSEPRLWDSGVQSSGSFSYTFDAPGTYLYRCQVHPEEMRGQVTVLAVTAEPGASPSASPQATAPAATPTPSLAPTVVPSGGGAPGGGQGGAAVIPAMFGGLLVVSGALLAALVLRRRDA